ncbi:4940_t:CDS:1, partial [Dentiscutata heterogama]
IIDIPSNSFLESLRVKRTFLELSNCIEISVLSTCHSWPLYQEIEFC